MTLIDLSIYNSICLCVRKNNMKLNVCLQGGSPGGRWETGLWWKEHHTGDFEYLMPETSVSWTTW